MSRNLLCRLPSARAFRAPPHRTLAPTTTSAVLPFRPAASPPPPTTTFRRPSSHGPMASSGTPSRKKVTIPSLHAMYARGEPITVLTAHDFPSAHAADAAGIEIVLVGDSLAMVALGLGDTATVTLEEMLTCCRSVARGVAGSGAAFVVGDLPMGSYEVSAAQAAATAIRYVKEGRVQAVKLEGGAAFAPQIRACVAAGIPVLAHIGLTPQRQHALGGFKVQGKDAGSALKVWRDAQAVQDAGAFAVVLEAVPAPVARLVTANLRIPTIGIGAGPHCSGQVLVQVDMSGYYPPGRRVPKFVKRFGDMWGEASRAMGSYRDEVKAGTFPAPEHTYAMPKEEEAEFERLVEEIKKKGEGED